MERCQAGSAVGGRLRHAGDRRSDPVESLVDVGPRLAVVRIDEAEGGDLVGRTDPQLAPEAADAAAVADERLAPQPEHAEAQSPTRPSRSHATRPASARARSRWTSRAARVVPAGPRSTPRADQSLT